jgi:hypothetical protein
MKIAVYGDSYASDHPNPQRASWVQRLRLLHPDWVIDNHAESGSGLYFSWQAFQNSYLHYDQHVVFVTQWDRWAIPYREGGFQHLNNPDALRETLLSGSWLSRLPGWGSREKQELQALYDFWTLVDTDQQRQHMHTLMLADLRRLAPQALFLPCFDSVGGSLMASPTRITLEDISMIDLDFYQPQHRGPVQFHSEWICMRTNHVNDWNSRLIADSISTWVTTGSIDSWDQQPWGVDAVRPFDWYFRARNKTKPILPRLIG